MRMKSFHLLGLIALAAATLHSQPANGAVYWSTVPPDCTSLAGESPVAIANSSGKTVGYSCYVSGTFVWLAAGGGWSSAIRVAAPASAAIGVDYTFYDASGHNLNLDTTIGSGSSTTSGNDVNFALSPNQPAEIGLLGATSDAPRYGSTATGSVYAVFYCPDATTCGNVVPQLLYSALPATPWALSVPISWDTELWTQWSAEGIDDGGPHRVSLVIYNEDINATSYTVRVYDSTGSLAGTGTTPLIPPLQPLGNGSFGEGGTYGALLSDVISTRLPAGVFKVLVDGGSKYSAVEALQFNGLSATALQVGYDSAPGSGSRAASVERMNIRSARVASTLKQVCSALEK
ncbi:MAG: hypothetical protein ABSG26_08630 [Bryobacteraceae bacterium]|jgi:hypothetical protein